ncbi:hypothetical protein [Streptomyces sp. NPDC046759]|uniref:hypothetical protein n=1 Tax=Streptomyces sp. NPDC046759 TaxID=3155019 RepID=UPI0033C0AA8D
MAVSTWPAVRFPSQDDRFNRVVPIALLAWSVKFTESCPESYKAQVTQRDQRIRATLFRWRFVEPVRRVHQARTRGADRGRDTVRQARADFRRTPFGAARPPAAMDRRELRSSSTRSLGRSTTALTKD